MMPKMIVTKDLKLTDQNGNVVVLPGAVFHPMNVIQVNGLDCYVCREEYKPGVPQLIMSYLVETAE